MNQIIKDKWLKALRSGEYKQGYGHLRQDDGCFCVMGVLCDLYTKETGCVNSNPYHADNEVYEWAEIDTRYKIRDHTRNVDVRRILLIAGESEDGSDIVEDIESLNDEYNFSFDSIANLIEEQM